jgi:oligogalacturonide lyase
MTTPRCLFALPAAAMAAAFFVASGAVAHVASAATAEAKEPPASWVDPDTGHRIVRLTREPGSASFYFTDNGYTPDGRQLVYTTPAGISVLVLATLQSRQIVPGPARAIVVGRKNPVIYYSKATNDPLYSTLWFTNVDTGETRKLADLPRRGSVTTINADETLAAGTYIEGDASAGGNFDGLAPKQTPSLDQPPNKVQMMATRLAARLPVTMFTVDLRTGAAKTLLQSTDWLNHLQFSPTDPTLLMYCHEGVKVQVDRIWTIRTDGSNNTLVHKRSIQMEGVGHEWWSRDGTAIWYDINIGRQTHTDGDKDYPTYTRALVGFVGGYNVGTGERIWYHYQPEEWSIHFNSSPDGTLFCGDGGRSPGSHWVYLFRPERVQDEKMLGDDLTRLGAFHPERLVNMSKHNYKLEPNVTFTPDAKWVIFRSNMFGPTYVFAVEVAKADAR